MKIIFIGGLFPTELKDEIENKSIGVIQYAADALQWALVKGLGVYTDKLKIINLPYIGSYPKRYKDLKIKTFQFSHRNDANDTNVGFINLPLYKLYSRYYNAKKALKGLLKNDGEVVIIYAIHTPFLKAAVKLKKENPTIKICLIVPDLPEFMGGSGFLYKILKHSESRLLKKLLKEVDAFVVLSDFMQKPLEIGHRPWVRVEGVFNPEIESKMDIEIREKPYKTILYTGTLAKRYGILNLLEAFSMIKDENYRLWICGDGDAKDVLVEMAKKDFRIKYFGQVSREEVLKLQKQATVLVNPRTSEGEYTKYSFPSKTMEYLASGTPCILYKLAGIPVEYLKYCYVSKEESVEGLSKTILSVCETTQSELDEFGKKAQEFILKNKTPQKQGKIIYEMLSKL